MTIGFEAKRFFTNYTGLGNYSRFVIDALSQRYADDLFYLFSPKTGDHEENRSILSRKNVRVVTPDGLASLPGFSALWRSFGMSRNSSVQKLNIFHGLSQELPIGLPKHIHQVVTVHDLIFLRYPKFYNAVDIAIYKRKVQAACQQADRIIAISHQTADDIKHYLNISDHGKIAVVYQGCHPIFKKDLSDPALSTVKKKYSLPSKFILNVGTVEERKNLKLIIKALGIIPKEKRLPLVVVGRHTSYYQEVVHEIRLQRLEDSVIFLTGVDFKDLPAIYKQAELFIYPSLFEGFGIPLIEAITCGVPVITSTGSCFKEAAGAGAVYVEPTNFVQLAQSMVEVLENPDKASTLKSEGSKHISQFESVVIAENLHRIYLALATESTEIKRAETV